jgi:hypothetical protein
MPDSFRGRCQPKRDTLVLQVGGLGVGLTKPILYKFVVMKPHIEYVRRPEFYKNCRATEYVRM